MPEWKFRRLYAWWCHEHQPPSTPDDESGDEGGNDGGY